MQAEGLFRRSANMKTVRDVQELLNCGERVDFDKLGGEQNGAHVAAVILKTFLRELEEPLLTFDLFQDVANFKNNLHLEQYQPDVRRLLTASCGPPVDSNNGDPSTQSLDTPKHQQRQQQAKALPQGAADGGASLSPSPTSSCSSSSNVSSRNGSRPSSLNLTPNNNSTAYARHAKISTTTYLSQIDPDRIKLELAKVLILQKLPDDNYKLLSFIFRFLIKVIDRKDLNKMTSSNLAIVFGPNLLWSKDNCASLSSISAINYFTQFLLDNYKSIFIK